MPNTAAMTTTPSAATGTGSMSGVATAATTATTTAVMSPTTCDVPPAAWLSAEREPLAEIAMARLKPAAMLAAPNAASSRFALISYPFLFAYVRALATVSANAISARPAAGSASSRTSCSDTSGAVNDGSPAGMLPTTATPRPCRSRVTEATPATTTARRLPGKVGATRLSTSTSARRTRLNIAVHQ